MSGTTYAATSVEKLASHWDPNEGASIESWCVMHESLNVTAPSLPDLVAKLNERFFLTIDEFFLPGDGMEITYFGFNRVETGDCDEPTLQELDQWENGDLKLFLCDYTFTVEKREVQSLTRADFDRAGLKTH